MSTYDARVRAPRPCEAWQAEQPILAAAPADAMRRHLVDCDDRECRDAVAWNLFLVADTAVRGVAAIRESSRRVQRDESLLTREVARLLVTTKGRKTVPRADLSDAYVRATNGVEES